MPQPYKLAPGRYDVYRVEDLRAQLDEIKPHNDVVLDCTNVESLECCCIGALIEKLNQWRVQKLHANLRLINVEGMAARVLSALGLRKLFQMEA